MAAEGYPLTGTLPISIAQRAINFGLETVGRPISIKTVFVLGLSREEIPGMPENKLDGMSSRLRTNQWSYDNTLPQLFKGWITLFTG